MNEGDTRNRIIANIYRAVQKLGGDRHLLAVLGSIGDTLSDEDVLAELEHWHRTYPADEIRPAEYEYKEPLRIIADSKPD